MEEAFLFGGRRERTDQDGLDSASKEILGIADIEYNRRKIIPGGSRESNRKAGINAILLGGVVCVKPNSEL